MSATLPASPVGGVGAAGRCDMPAMLAALDRLQDAGPEFDGFLSNHGPMAADAMIRLGGEHEVERWVDRYRRRLGPAVPSRGGVNDTTWREHLGRYERIGDWIGYFRRRAATSAWIDLFVEWWPRLLPGAAAGATHGLIRTAHAVRNLASSEVSEPLLVDELASGLAYWAARYQRLPGTPSLSGRQNLDEAIAELPRLDRAVRPTGPGISGRLLALFDLHALPTALDGWGPSTLDASALDDLIAAGARVVASRSDAPIAYCHAVTAPAAVRMILAHLPVEMHRAAVAACWQVVASIVAAFAAEPEPAGDGTGDTPVPAPGELAPLALAHGDDHVLKLTEACLRQFASTGDPTLLVAADRFRRRIRPAW
jgi:hypothetical protein